MGCRMRGTISRNHLGTIQAMGTISATSFMVLEKGIRAALEVMCCQSTTEKAQAFLKSAEGKHWTCQGRCCDRGDCGRRHNTWGGEIKNEWRGGESGADGACEILSTLATISQAFSLLGPAPVKYLAKSKMAHCETEAYWWVRGSSFSSIAYWYTITPTRFRTHLFSMAALQQGRMEMG